MHHHNNKQGNLAFEPGTVRGQTHEIAIAEFNWYFSGLDLMNSQNSALNSQELNWVR